MTPHSRIARHTGSAKLVEHGLGPICRVTGARLVAVKVLPGPTAARGTPMAGPNPVALEPTFVLRFDGECEPSSVEQSRPEFAPVLVGA
jgi:hypothetical protein